MPIDLRRARPGNGRLFGGLLGSLGLVLVLLTLLVAIEWSPLMDVDQSVARWAYDVSFGHGTWIALQEAAAFWLGPIALRVVLLVCAVVALVRRELRISVWLLVVVVVENIVAPWSKYLLDRSRPDWSQALTAADGFSYPSGHSAAAGMFAATLILLTVVLTGKGPARRLLFAVWVVIALVVASNRLFLGVHYLTDVVGGLVLGVLIALAAWVGTVWNAVGETTQRAATTGTGSKRLAVVLNPIKVSDVEVFKGRLEIAAERAGWNPPRWFETLPDDPGVSMTEQALAEGVDLVIAAGGDGTVRIVCSELARTGVAAGIVPLGTGNLLARNLGVPLHPGEAIETAFNGQDRAIDIVSLSGEGFEDTTFMVMAGLGLDAAIMTGAPDELKAKMGWLAYVVSGLRQLFRFPATRVQISIDGGPFVKRRARTVVIGNVGYLQAGIPLLPDAVIDDGKLDVVVVAPAKHSGWVRVAARLFTKRKRVDERLDRMIGREVVVRADKPTPMQLDGDPIGEGIELRAEVIPGVLLVRVPH